MQFIENLELRKNIIEFKESFDFASNSALRNYQ